MRSGIDHYQEKHFVLMYDVETPTTYWEDFNSKLQNKYEIINQTSFTRTIYCLLTEALPTTY